MKLTSLLTYKTLIPNQKYRRKFRRTNLGEKQNKKKTSKEQKTNFENTLQENGRLATEKIVANSLQK